MSALHLDIAAPADDAHSAPGPWLRVVSGAEHGQDVAASEAEARVARAEQAVERHEYTQAVAMLVDAHISAAATPALALRALRAESWARMSLGELDEPLALLDRARALAEAAQFTEADRADVLFRTGCCRFNGSATSNAVALFTLALELCDRSGVACDRLRARILDWRSRCYQRNRDWQAARADIERGLELSEGAGDDQIVAHLYFQASIIAEREGQCMLARCSAEQAMRLYLSCDDQLNVHRVLNNLGGINFLLGDHDEAVACLQEAFRIALELGSDIGAAYTMSSLAQVQLGSGEPAAAERHAQRALDLLGSRDDHVAEIGNAQLVLGRAFLEQSRLDEAAVAFRAAEASFERLASASHVAAAWVAQGDLAARRGDIDAGARLYRQAADALQDFRF